ARITLLGMVLAGFLGTAQNFDRAKLDRYFDALEQQDRFMGSVAVSKGGELLYSRAMGYADLDAQIKADPETKYRIGSISKTFTAVLAIKAVEAKLLALDQKLGEIVPKIPKTDQLNMTQLLAEHNATDNDTNEQKYHTY